MNDLPAGGAVLELEPARHRGFEVLGNLVDSGQDLADVIRPRLVEIGRLDFLRQPPLLPFERLDLLRQRLELALLLEGELGLTCGARLLSSRGAPPPRLPPRAFALGGGSRLCSLSRGDFAPRSGRRRCSMTRAPLDCLR